jgi:hypothetical protein
LIIGMVMLVVETRILWPVAPEAGAITGGLVVLGAGGLVSLC